MKACPSPETMLLAQRLAIVAGLPETGAWIIVDGSGTAALYLDLIEAHRGGAVSKSVRFAVAYNAAAARRARLEGDLPIFQDPAFTERHPQPPATGTRAPRTMLLVGKPEHIELIVELIGFGFALDDLLDLDLASLEQLALQADLVAALLDLQAA